jgi:hypothetical protein
MQILFSYIRDLSSDRCLCFIVFLPFWLFNYCKDNFQLHERITVYVHTVVQYVQTFFMRTAH